MVSEWGRREWGRKQSRKYSLKKYYELGKDENRARHNADKIVEKILLEEA